MTLEVIQSGSPPEGRDLSQAIVELQNISFSVVAGAAADTNITLTGYSAAGGDTIKSILHFDISAGNVVNLLDKTSELQAGSTDSTFQLSTTATTGDVLLVVWFNKGAL